MLLRYKAAITLKDGTTEEYILRLGYTVIMPDFQEGKYIESNFREVMVTGPKKTIDLETLWTPTTITSVGKENSNVLVKLFISGNIHYREKETERNLTKGADLKLFTGSIDFERSEGKFF
jgi:hypothetical protein